MFLRFTNLDLGFGIPTLTTLTSMKMYMECIAIVQTVPHEAVIVSNANGVSLQTAFYYHPNIVLI